MPISSTPSPPLPLDAGVPRAPELLPVSWRDRRGCWVLKDTGQVRDPAGSHWQVTQARVTACCVLLRLHAVGQTRRAPWGRSLVLLAGDLPAPAFRRLKVRLRFP